MTIDTDTVFSIVSILVVRITKVGYGWKANEFIFPTILRYVMYIPGVFKDDQC